MCCSNAQSQQAVGSQELYSTGSTNFVSKMYVHVQNPSSLRFYQLPSHVFNGYLRVKYVSQSFVRLFKV